MTCDFTFVIGAKHLQGGLIDRYDLDQIGTLREVFRMGVQVLDQILDAPIAQAVQKLFDL